MAYCKACGKEIDKKSNFCIYCGAKQMSESSLSQNQEESPINKEPLPIAEKPLSEERNIVDRGPKKQKNKWLYFFITPGMLIILGLIGLWVVRSSSDHNKTKSNNMSEVEASVEQKNQRDVEETEIITWGKTFTLGENEFVTDITPIANGDLLISGIKMNSINDKVFYLWILKIDKNGSILWKKGYNNIVSSLSFYPKNTILPVSQDEFIAVGSLMESDEKLNGVIAQFQKNGNEILEKPYIVNDYNCLFTSVTKSKEKGFIVIGIKYNREITNGLIIEFNANLDFVAEHNLNIELKDEIPLIVELQDERILLAGVLSDRPIWINALGKNYITLWRKELGDSNDDLPYIFMIKSEFDNNITFMGYRKSEESNSYENVLIKYDNNGNELWSKRIEALYCSSIATTKDNGYLISANKNNSIYLIKYNNEGIWKWERKILGSEYENNKRSYNLPAPLKRISPNSYILAFPTYNEYGKPMLRINKFYLDN